MGNEGNEQPAIPTPYPTRTGPVGRVARLVLGGSVGSVVYGLWVGRLAIFSPSEGLLNPGLLMVTGLVLYGVYTVADDLFGWGWRSLAVLGLLAVAAAVVTVGWAGTLWAGPFTWLVWGLNISVLTVIVITVLFAVILGTPGCEVGVLRGLARRLGGSVNDDKPMFCLVGLGALDRWESGQAWFHGR